MVDESLHRQEVPNHECLLIDATELAHLSKKEASRNMYDKLMSRVTEINSKYVHVSVILPSAIKKHAALRS